MTNPIEVNVYCDESCHLEHDKSKFMVLGAIWLPKAQVAKVNREIAEIKYRHGRKKNYEIKWTKIYAGNLDLALELVDYFFSFQNLRFRGYIINKVGLDHDSHLQSHNTWYYKMYYRMLEYVVDFNHQLDIYIDIKDTQSSSKIRTLHEYFNSYTKSRGLNSINKIQAIKSDEVQIMQLVDIFIGALRYVNEGLDTSISKQLVIERIKQKSGFKLKYTNGKNRFKFNIFRWDPTKVETFSS